MIGFRIILIVQGVLFIDVFLNGIVNVNKVADSEQSILIIF